MERADYNNGIRRLNTALLLAAFLGLPLAGLALAGREVSPYLRFPPWQRDMGYPGDNPVLFWGFWVLAGFFILLWIFLKQPVDKTGHPQTARKTEFPWWGWAGFGCLIFFWVLAWNRFAWFAPLQEYTFTPIWLSFIVAINSLAFRKSGECPLLQRPRGLLLLFFASAAFWWGFEFLNRFVQNWHYLEVENIGPLKYFLHGTICFSTVLPAVYTVKCYLQTFPGLQRLGASGPLWRIRFEEETAALVFLSVLLAFFFIGLYPGFLFPLLWAGPLAAWLSLNCLTKTPVWLGGLREGNWAYFFNWALAALLCGFFWEMWNFYSLAKWVYQISFFESVKVFEMPLAGYSGYLPFGLQCALAAEAVLALTKGKTDR